MSIRDKPSSQDGRLQEVFGAPVAELYEKATGPGTSAAVTRAVELRGFLALAEEQVTWIRDRVREAMAPERDMNELSADELRMDTQWLEAALKARDGYRHALDDLLRTMPPLQHQTGPARRAEQRTPTAQAPAAAAPAPSRAGPVHSR